MALPLSDVVDKASKIVAAFSLASAYRVNEPVVRHGLSQQASQIKDVSRASQSLGTGEVSDGWAYLRASLV